MIRPLLMCIGVAFLYSVSLPLLGWLLGGPNSLGTAQLFPPDFKWWQRIAFSGFTVAIFLLAGWLTLKSFCFLLDIAQEFRLALALSLLVVITGFIAAGTLPALDWLGAEGISILVLSILIGGACASAIGLLWWGGYTFGILPSAMIHKLSFGYSLIWVGCFSAAVACIWALGQGLRGTFDPAILICSVIPLVNGVFDWLSLAISRYLLGRVLRQDLSWLMKVAHILVDTMLAYCFLFGLAFSIPFFIEFLGYRSVDWKGYVTSVELEPWTSGVFVSAMLVSTLLPTGLHFVLAVLSVALPRFPGREMVISLLGKKELAEIENLLVFLWLLTLTAFSACVVGFVVFGVLHSSGNHLVILGEALIECAEAATELANRLRR